MKLLSWFAALLAVAGVACAADTSGAAVISARDSRLFTGEVLPVLARDCGFNACHGSQERLFRVFARGRARLMTGNPLETPISGEERDISYQMTLSMIDPFEPERSPLLRKPLAVEAGGSVHEGVDKYGRNIYRTPQEEGYKTLARFVYSVAPQMAGTPPVAPPAP